MSFYVQVIIAFVLVAFPAYVKLRTDKGKPYFKELFICALLGAILSFIISFNSHKSAIQSSQTAKENDSLYKDLLKRNLQSAYKIIDSLDTTVSTSRIVLNRSVDILEKQNKSGILLNEQLKNTYSLLNSSKVTIGNTNKAIFELYRNTNSFTDFKMTLQIQYDISFADVGSYTISGDQITKTADILPYAEQRLNSDTLYAFDVEYDKDLSEVLETHKTGNATLYLDTTGKIAKIKIKNPDFSNDTGYESFLPKLPAVKMKFYKKIYTDGTEAQNYNKTLPDLIMEVGKNENNLPKIFCDEAVIDVKKWTVKESFTAYMVRYQDNNQIKSAVDLNGTYLFFYGFKPERPKYDYVRLDYGSQYSSYIDIDASKIDHNLYVFPLKNVEGLKHRLRN